MKDVCVPISPSFLATRLQTFHLGWETPGYLPDLERRFGNWAANLIVEGGAADAVRDRPSVPIPRPRPKRVAPRVEPDRASPDSAPQPPEPDPQPFQLDPAKPAQIAFKPDPTQDLWSDLDRWDLEAEAEPAPQDDWARRSTWRALGPVEDDRPIERSGPPALDGADAIELLPRTPGRPSISSSPIRYLPAVTKPVSPEDAPSVKRLPRRLEGFDLLEPPAGDPAPASEQPSPSASHASTPAASAKPRTEANRERAIRIYDDLAETAENDGSARRW